MHHFTFSWGLRETIANDALTPGLKNDTNGHWLSHLSAYNDHVYRNSLFLKDTLLSIISEFS